MDLREQPNLQFAMHHFLINVCRERRANLQRHFTSYQTSLRRLRLVDVVEDVRINRNSTQPHVAIICYVRGMDATEPLNLETVIARVPTCRERQADIQRHFIVKSSRDTLHVHAIDQQAIKHGDDRRTYIAGRCGANYAFQLTYQSTPCLVAVVAVDGPSVREVAN